MKLINRQDAKIAKRKNRDRSRVFPPCHFLAILASWRLKYLQIDVIRTASAFRRHPINDLVRVHDVARLAMHAVREVDLGLAPSVGLLDFVDGGRAEILAWIAVFLCASPYTDVEIEHFQMRRLIFIVFGARAVNI